MPPGRSQPMATPQPSSPLWDRQHHPHWSQTPIAAEWATRAGVPCTPIVTVNAFGTVPLAIVWKNPCVLIHSLANSYSTGQNCITKHHLIWKHTAESLQLFYLNMNFNAHCMFSSVTRSPVNTLGILIYLIQRLSIIDSFHKSLFVLMWNQTSNVNKFKRCDSVFSPLLQVKWTGNIFWAWRRRLHMFFKGKT